MADRAVARDEAPDALPAPLGIGFPYIAALPADLYDPAVLDFVEVTPEVLCRERRRDGTPSLVLLPAQLEQARRVCGGLPVVVHGVELSLGSASGWNIAYLDMLDRFAAAWPFLWHSEHLSFQTMAGDGLQHHVDIGVPLPLPATEEAAALAVERCLHLQRRYGVPFLLENAACYLKDLPADPAIGDDIGLMNRITARAGCHHLLDLHNLYCNAVNHGFDAPAEIARFDLERVLEIHIAGGSWQHGFWVDAHDGRVPEPVWELLDFALPRCPNLGGVVFELLDDHALRLGAGIIADELGRARKLWRRHRAPAMAAPVPA
jgi:uncharacterized protein (UPF0276 family)